MIVFPHPYQVQGTSLRVYDAESEIGKIVRAVIEPQSVPESGARRRREPARARDRWQAAAVRLCAVAIGA